MPAKIIEVCDAVADRIRDSLDDPGSAEVSREWVLAADADRVSGRKVYVFPAQTQTVMPATRAEDLKGYTVSVVVAERYEEPGDPQADGFKEWCDALTEWVESQVFDRIEDPRAEPLLGELWPAESRWNHCEPAWLLQNKLYWSEIDVQFQRHG